MSLVKNYDLDIKRTISSTIKMFEYRNLKDIRILHQSPDKAVIVGTGKRKRELAIIDLKKLPETKLAEHVYSIITQKDIRELEKEKEFTKIVVVYNNDNSISGSKLEIKLGKYYRILQVLPDSFILREVGYHVDQPKINKIMSIKKYMEKNNLKFEESVTLKIPKIKLSDPLAIYLGISENYIIEFLRENRFPYYRICVNY